MIKKILVLSMVSCAGYLYGMDSGIPELSVLCSYIREWNNQARPVKPEVAQRHNVVTWHEELHKATIYNEPHRVQELLHQAGNDATELVSTQWSTYGSIVELTYIEEKPEIREMIMPYVDEDCLISCFKRRKQMLHETWIFNASQEKKYKMHQTLPSAENIVRDFYNMDSRKFPLNDYECQQLGIKK